MLALEFTTVARTPAKVTDVGAARFVPVISTVVPPLAGPTYAESLRMDGGRVPVGLASGLGALGALAEEDAAEEDAAADAEAGVVGFDAAVALGAPGNAADGAAVEDMDWEGDGKIVADGVLPFGVGAGVWVAGASPLIGPATLVAGPVPVVAGDAHPAAAVISRATATSRHP